MGSLTAGAIILLLTFITPAIPILIAFRLAFPRARTIAPSEGMLIVFSTLLSLLLNWDLLMFMGDQVGTTLLSTLANTGVEIPAWEYAATRLLLIGKSPLPQLRPAYWILSTLSNQVSPTNVVVFLLDLHVTTAIIAVLFLKVVSKATKLNEQWELDRYEESRRSIESRYLNEKPHHNIFYKRIKYIREAFYHPWSLITLSNRLREILMVDVLTTEGSLYSGKLTNWVPDGNSISAVVMEYPLKYGKTKRVTQDSQKEPANSLASSTEPSPQATKSEKSVGRPKYLIPNNGELVIPNSKIETVHFWEIRRGCENAIVVDHAFDIEVVKWYMLLAFTHPGFINKLSVIVALKGDDLEAFQEELLKWMDFHRITFPSDDFVEFTFTEQAVAP